MRAFTGYCEVFISIQPQSQLATEFGVARSVVFCYAAQHPQIFTFPVKLMIRCHLSTLMGRDKLRISDVAHRTGLNRSTITALYNETATRVDLTTIEILCGIFQCQVGDLLEIIPSPTEVNS